MKRAGEDGYIVKDKQTHNVTSAGDGGERSGDIRAGWDSNSPCVESRTDVSTFASEVAFASFHLGDFHFDQFLWSCI